MKKIISFILSLILLFSFAALAVDARSATETARALAPEGSVYLYTEKDGKVYEVHFLNEATGEEIEISVPTEEGKYVKIETENDFSLGSVQNTVTEDVVLSAVLAQYPMAQMDSYFTVKEDGLFEVHVYFTAPDHFGRVKLNAETGDVIERKIILSAPFEGWQAELDEDYFGISPEKAAAAEEKIPSESANDKKSSSKENKNSTGSNKSSYVSLSQAKSAVTSRHPGARISEIEFDFEGGKYVYEGEAYLNGREYDFRVDAVTGSLIKWKLDD